MLGIIVLQELTSLTKGLLTLVATIRKIGRSFLPMGSIREHGCTGQIRLHGLLLLGKLVNGITGILGAATTSAKTTFHVLYCISTRSESTFFTNRTCHTAGPMNLHVHVQFILGSEDAVAFTTLILMILLGAAHAIAAARDTIALAKLIRTEVVPTTPITTLSTITDHLLVVL